MASMARLASSKLGGVLARGGCWPARRSRRMWLAITWAAGAEASWACASAISSIIASSWARSSGDRSARSMPAAAAASASASSLITGPLGAARRPAGRSGSGSAASVALDGHFAARGPQAHGSIAPMGSEGGADGSSSRAARSFLGGSAATLCGLQPTEAGLAPTRPPQTWSAERPSSECVGSITVSPVRRSAFRFGRMSASRRPPSSHPGGRHTHPAQQRGPAH